MPKGFGAIKAAAEKMNSGGKGGNVLYLKLDDGESATIRFLEQGDDVYSYWYHDLTNISKAQGWKTKVPCLDQDDDGTPCPGCHKDLPRKFQGLINVIWRDAPVYGTDDEGNIDWKKKTSKTADQVAVWRAGIELFSKTLARKDVTYKGLSSRDFEVVREGLKLNTSYSVEPVVVDGETKAVPLSEEDEKLAESKYDLVEIARFQDYDAAEKILDKKIAELQGEDDDEDDGDDVSQFLKKKPFEEQ
jgi:hypothetical protein